MFSDWELFSTGEVARKVQRAMEHTQNLDAAIGRAEVGDSIMAVEQNPDIGTLSETVTDLGETQENLCALVDGQNRSVGGLLVVLGDVVVDLLQPASRLSVQTTCATTQWLCASPHG